MTMSRMPRLLAPAVVAVTAALAAFGLPASALAGPDGPVPGSVRQVSGPDGCYTSDGSSMAGGASSCVNIRGGDGSTTIVISPNGRSAYLVGYGGDKVPPVLSVFSRDPKTGVLTQLHGAAGCFSRNGSSEDGPGTCTKARDLDTGDATSIAISGDGRFVYVASQYTKSPADIGGIAIFARNTATGALRQLPGTDGCISADGSSSAGAGTCARGREVDDISNLRITPDQKYLYASNYDSKPHSGIAIFRRNLKTGVIRQLGGVEGCVTDDGTTDQSGAKVVCRAMPNLGTPWDVATPGNTFVYIPDKDDNLVQAFRRDASGGLVPLHGTGACVSDSGNSPLGVNTCVTGRGLFDVERAVLSKNEKFIYTNGYTLPSPIAVLNRNPKTGLLSQRPGTAACYSFNGTTGDSAVHCRTGRLLAGGYAGKLSPDGNTLYYAENGNTSDSGLVIFHVNANTGGFTQLPGKAGCVSADGASQQGAGTCQKGRAVHGAYQVGVYSPGKNVALDVYVASETENGVAFFRAAP